MGEKYEVMIILLVKIYISNNLVDSGYTAAISTDINNPHPPAPLAPTVKSKYESSTHPVG